MYLFAPQRVPLSAEEEASTRSCYTRAAAWSLCVRTGHPEHVQLLFVSKATCTKQADYMDASLSLGEASAGTAGCQLLSGAASSRAVLVAAESRLQTTNVVLRCPIVHRGSRGSLDGVSVPRPAR